MASFGMGFVHAMLIDITDGSDRGSTWDRERRLTDTLVETSLRFDDQYEPLADDPEPAPPPPPEPPRGALGNLLTDALALLTLRPLRLLAPSGK